MSDEPRVLAEGEIALLLRDAGVDYEDYYQALTHADMRFAVRGSVDEVIAYGPARNGRKLRMRYRVLPREGIHLRQVRVVPSDVYRRLIALVSRGDNG